MIWSWFRKEEPVVEVSLRRDGNTVWLDCPETLRCTVKMYDLGYRKILDYAVNTNSGIGLTTFPRGFYTLCVVTAQGYKVKKKIEIGI